MVLPLRKADLETSAASFYTHVCLQHLMVSDRNVIIIFTTSLWGTPIGKSTYAEGRSLDVSRHHSPSMPAGRYFWWWVGRSEMLSVLVNLSWHVIGCGWSFSDKLLMPGPRNRDWFLVMFVLGGQVCVWRGGCRCVCVGMSVSSVYVQAV